MKTFFWFAIIMVLLISIGIDCERKRRNAVADENRLWPHKTVPYLISEEFSFEEVGYIQAVLKEFEEKSCLTFIQRSYEQNYILVLKHTGYCSSAIGMVGGIQKIRLTAQCVRQKWMIIHEFLHALGFFHEHSRQDRDKYITVIPENIIPGFEEDYKIVFEKENYLNSSYDHESVLHYPDWGVNEPAIIARDAKKIGNQEGFSQKDLEKLNKLYKC